MKLSLKEILNEITARKGPRTGAMEINKKEAWDFIGKIIDEIKKTKKIPFGKTFTGRFTNPITGKKERRKVELNLDVFKGKQGGAFYTKDGRIIILVPEDYDWASFFGKRTKLSQILSHELVHSFDVKLNKKERWNKPENLKDYLRSSEEIKAHLLDVRNEIIQNMFDYQHGGWKINFNSYQKKPLELLRSFSPTWKFIETHLDEQSKRRFYKLAFNIAQNFDHWFN